MYVTIIVYRVKAKMDIIERDASVWWVNTWSGYCTTRHQAMNSCTVDYVQDEIWYFIIKDPTS